MRGPIPAEEIIPPQGRFPGVCQSSGIYGFFVPYQQVGRIEGIVEQWEAVIELFVRDSHSKFVGLIPFLIDTGTHVTIIPRKLVKPYAFPVMEAVPPYFVPVTGLTGWTVSGRTYSATLAIAPPSANYDSLEFGSLTVVVVEDEDWEDDCAVLGLDALRKVAMVSDREHLAFWPLPPEA